MTSWKGMFGDVKNRLGLDPNAHMTEAEYAYDNYGTDYQSDYRADHRADHAEHRAMDYSGREDTRTTPVEMIEYVIHEYNDVAGVCDAYAKGQVIVIDLRQLDKATARRVLDFFSGAAYYAAGKVLKIEARVFALTPYDVAWDNDQARRAYYKQQAS